MGGFRAYSPSKHRSTDQSIKYDKINGNIKQKVETILLKAFYKEDLFYVVLALIYLVLLFFLGVESRWYFTASLVYVIPSVTLTLVNWYQDKKRNRQ